MNMDKKSIVFILMILTAIALVVLVTIQILEPTRETREQEKAACLPLYCLIEYTNLEGETTHLLNPACSNNKQEEKCKR